MTTKNQSKADQNSKLIRQISQLPHNKNCFDCGQKGPTYVNETIGSFVCTGCSGILRGLNPPQRIKSISMGTFTDDEVRVIQLRGNAFCKKAWLWNYDPQIGPRPPEVRDDQKMKDFLIAKYEKKRWYHGPHETHLADQLKQEDTVGTKHSQMSGSESQQSSLSRKTSTNSTTSSQRSFRQVDSTGSMAAPISNGNVSQSTPNGGNNISLPRSHTSSMVSNHSAPENSGHNSDELFSIFGGMSVSSPAVTPSAGASSTSVGSVSDWANFGRSQTMHSFHNPAAPPSNGGYLHDSTSNRAPASATLQEPNKPLQPAPAKFHTQPVTQPKTVPAVSPSLSTSSSDKYAALAELDEMMHGSPQKPGSSDVPAGPSWMNAPPPKPLPGSGNHMYTVAGRASHPAAAWPPNVADPFRYGEGAFQQSHVPQMDGWVDNFQQQKSNKLPGAGSNFDANNVWAQIPTHPVNRGNGIAPTNPFLSASPSTNSHAFQHNPPKQGSHPTNPFL